MDEKLVRRTAFASIIFIMIVVIFLESYTKRIDFTDDKIDDNVIIDEISGGLDGGLITFDDAVKIPLPKGVMENDIVINHSMIDRFCTIIISYADFLIDETMIEANAYGVSEYNYIDWEKGIELQLSLNGLYDYETLIKDQHLYIKFFNPRDVYSYIIVIDAGHGGTDTGALVGNIYEKDINLSVMHELKKRMDEENKIKAYYTRTTDVRPSLSARVELANVLKADLFLSIHSNANENSSIRGFEVLYSENDTNRELNSKWFSNLCHEEVMKLVSIPDRGLIHGNYIYVIRNAIPPVAFIEMGYMTNAKDLAIINSKEVQKKYAEGLYQAILRAVNEIEDRKED